MRDGHHGVMEMSHHASYMAFVITLNIFFYGFFTGVRSLHPVVWTKQNIGNINLLFVR